MTRFYHSDGICISEIVYSADGEFAKVDDNIKLNRIYYDQDDNSRPYIKVYKQKYYLDEFVRDTF